MLFLKFIFNWHIIALVGIKFATRNINNIRYTDDTTLMAESEEELKSLLMKVKEESKKSGLRFVTFIILPSSIPHFCILRPDADFMVIRCLQSLP